MNMFDSLRDTLQNVQEGITASLRGLTVSDTTSSRRPNKSSTSRSVNYNAGAELLHKYQEEWHSLHQVAEENAKKADLVDQMIGSLHQNLDKQWTDIGTMYSALSSVPQLINKVQDIMEEISSLRTSFEEVENSLLALEDLVETQALREEQLDHRFQLAMYKEKRLQELEQLKNQLEAQHKEKVHKFEEQQATLLKERQAAFGEAFKQEMDSFKKSGQLPKVAEIRSTLDREPSLEEVDLEVDSSALDEFLEDMTGDDGASLDLFGASSKGPEPAFTSPGDSSPLTSD